MAYQIIKVMFNIKGIVEVYVVILSGKLGRRGWFSRKISINNARFLQYIFQIFRKPTK